jgi:hypothetical protein
MPVTFFPFPGNEISPAQRIQRVSPTTASSLLSSTQKQESEPKSKKVVELLQSTFGRGNAIIKPLIPFKHGLVHTVLEAYNQHHALVLRPDDIWIAVINQFSLFVNGEDSNGTPRAERLRQCFVSHEDKRTLVVVMGGTRNTVDYRQFADLMVEKIDEAVVDPMLKTWIVPSFSTTTPNDRIVASVMVMATLKNYFDYELRLRCGIPQVTLAGTRDDWLDIYRRVDKLVEYGPEAAAWRDLLRPVLVRFVRSFDEGWADSTEGREFWQRIVHYRRGGSGPSFLSGWITAFCTFNDTGVSQARNSTTSQASSVSRPGLRNEAMSGWVSIFLPSAMPQENMHHAELDYTFGIITSRPEPYNGQSLEMDGMHYHTLDTTKIPSACAEVDVRLNDNGEQFDTVMVAGMVGMSTADVLDQRTVKDGTVIKNGEVAPVAAWWMYITES